MNAIRVRLKVLAWLPLYRAEWVRPDLVAGVTLAAYLIPAALGDASLANLPPEARLYACLLAGLTFWLFCSSRQTAITVTSAILLLVGASLGEYGAGDPARFAALAACTALMTGGIYFAGWLGNAGVVVNFISETVLVGFKSGIALFLASTQLPKLCGFDHGSHLAFQPGSEPLCNLYVSVLNQFGLADKTFGTATGPLKGLEFA